MIVTIARHTMRISGVVLGLLLILLALFTVAARLALPVVASYKHGIEARVSHYLNAPVKIGELSLEWDGFGPLLTATDVVVSDSANRQTGFDQLLVEVNLAKSLFLGLPVIDELSLIGARLVVDADPDGKLFLRGMDRGNGHTTGKTVDALAGAAPGVDYISWLLKARNVRLLDSTVSLIDQHSNRSIIVKDLTILAQNNEGIHQLRVDLTLPEELGGKVEAGFDLDGGADTLQASDGRFYLAGENLRLQGLMQMLRLAGVQESMPGALSALDTGFGMELWGHWQDGKLVSLRGPLQTSAIVDVQSGESLHDELSASLVLQRTSDNHELTVTDIKVVSDKETMHIDNIVARWHHSDLRRWSVSGNSNRLALPAAARMPLALIEDSAPDLAESLRQASLSGEMVDWRFHVESGGDKPIVSLTGNVENFTSTATDELPGIGPLQAEVQWNDATGSISMTAQQMPLRWSRSDESVVTVDSISAVASIDLTQANRFFSDMHVELLDDGIDSRIRIKSTIPSGESPHLEVIGRYSAQDITAFKQWLPKSRMSPRALRWIDRAILGGSVSDGTLLFFGKPSEFPFTDGEGVFKSTLRVRDGQLSFLPNWPTARSVNATLDINQLRVTGSADAAQLADFEISNSQFQIPDLTAPVLFLEGTSSGQLTDLIKFGKAGPLERFLKPALSNVSATGQAQVDLQVVAPLFAKPEAAAATSDEAAVGQNGQRRTADWQPLKVSGSVFLNNNDVRFDQANLTLENTKGAIGFSLQGIQINDLQANMLGRRVLVDAQTQGRGQQATTEILVQGAMEASDVLAHYGNTMDQFVTGASSWDVRLFVPHSAERLLEEGVRLFATTDLVGSELRLPAPLNKGSAVSVPFEIETAFQKSRRAQRWTLRYGSQLTVSALVSNNQAASLLLHFGNKEISTEVLENSQPGVRIQGEVERLSVDGWVRALDRYIDSLPARAADDGQIMPVSASVDTENLLIGRTSLGPAGFQVNTDDVFLNAVVNNAYLSGNLRYPRRILTRETALQMRIRHLNWAVVDALQAASTATPTASKRMAIDPTLLPPIDARIAKLTRKNLQIRDLVIRAEPEVSGLQFTTIGFAYETMRLVGDGRWQLRDPQAVNPELSGEQMTHLNLVLQSDDFGKGLDAIGLNDIILDGYGDIDVALSWNGPAYSPSLSELNGSVAMLMEGGSVVPFEPGAARMMGLFALQALPRRLSLDFKDMTADGLAFKRITGDVAIEDGVADVRLIQLTGPVGVVDIKGQSDLRTREFDQTVAVLPRVSAAVPILGAISGGASAGIGAIVATGVLKAMGLDIDRIGLRKYSLTGPWEKPVLQSQ
ncbi:MAG: YhdP family protein [Granulosicoccus sp.]